MAVLTQHKATGRRSLHHDANASLPEVPEHASGIADAATTRVLIALRATTVRSASQ